MQEIKRLSTTIRGRIAAEQRLKNAGEYAIPYMLDALGDPDRKDEFANITGALPKIGRGAIRPLVASLQMENSAVKGEVVKALGEIGYRQSLGYLKYVAERDGSELVRKLAERAIERIDPSANKIPATQLLFGLGEAYYNHTESISASAEYDFANIWFWDADAGKLTREEVDKAYFNELMAMRACEWSLKADENTGGAIALWLAAFFKAEGTGVAQPAYFGEGHADAMTYATTAGPEYLHEGLERALGDKDAYVSLGLVEALAANAGEKSLLYRIGTEQPLVKALSFDDRMVRYSSAIAIGEAGPNAKFVGSKLIIENLAAAIGDSGTEELGEELADIYAMRAINVMLKLSLTRNSVVDVSQARDALVEATKDSRSLMQVISGQVLARLSSPDAQRAIADMALSEANIQEIRVAAFGSLAISAKINAMLLADEQVDAIYELISSDSTDPVLRSAAASAYGALNLPSRKVKTLILDQSVS
jgi:HEAT repeat protein